MLSINILKQTSQHFHYKISANQKLLPGTKPVLNDQRADLLILLSDRTYELAPHTPGLHKISIDDHLFLRK
ncbi:MAG: hypothetical protein OFPII_42740 [Osedax symbiont Rs1]|nr:MAG: hypothetical protein OFPII_42740 [Osedax symbiont Rs1]